MPDWSTRVSRGLRGQYDMAIFGASSDNTIPPA
jgi:peptide/nickel transport system substrate-binding protein